jgi:hypothetical protein
MGVALEAIMGVLAVDYRLRKFFDFYLVDLCLVWRDLHMPKV